MKTFYICTANCITKDIDSQRIYDYLIANDYTFTKNYSKADLIIITTCAFCDLKEEQSIKAIKYYMKHKSSFGKIIITGCLPKINSARLSNIDNFKVISPTELDKFDDLIKANVKF